jgi:hypothetical protein
MTDNTQTTINGVTLVYPSYLIIKTDAFGNIIIITDKLNPTVTSCREVVPTACQIDAMIDMSLDQLYSLDLKVAKLMSYFRHPIFGTSSEDYMACYKFLTEVRGYTSYTDQEDDDGSTMEIKAYLSNIVSSGEYVYGDFSSLFAKYPAFASYYRQHISK